jgi:hypothetical protein
MPETILDRAEALAAQLEQGADERRGNAPRFTDMDVDSAVAAAAEPDAGSCREAAVPADVALQSWLQSVKGSLGGTVVGVAALNEVQAQAKTLLAAWS